MKIRRIRIRSFGGIRDRDYPVGECMTVFYGPNESGKTSTMEFIRETLSQDNKKNKYPARGRTDEGTLEYEEDGAEQSVVLKGRKVSGTPPGCMKGMDPELYRDIFSLDAGTLDRTDALTKGDVKTKFLTVPGADGMPEVLKWVDSEVKGVYGVRSNSDSMLNGLNAKLDRSWGAVCDMRSKASEYGALAEKRDALVGKKKALIEAGAADAEARSVYENYRSNRGNFDRLAAMEAERQTLGEFKAVTEEDIAAQARLSAAVEAARGEKDSLEAEKSSARMRLGGADPRKVESLSQEIGLMPGRLSAYREDVERLSSMRREPAPAVQRKGASKLGAVVGLIIVLVGVVLGVAVHPAAFVLSVAGIAVAAFSLKRGKPEAPVQPHDDSRRAELEAEVSRFEKDLRTLCAELDVQSRSPESSVRELTGLVEAASALKALDQKLLASRARFSEANNALLAFYQPYAGEAGFDAARRKTLRKTALDRDIASVEEAIRSAGLDPRSPECPVEWEASGNDAALAEVGREIGETESKMNGILSMEDLESEMDRLAALKAEKEGIMRRGAVAMIAQRLITDACNEAYGTISPGVITSADKFLRYMTEGRYSMSIDPASGEIALRTDGETKEMSKWSSGLRAQALLSIKLAIAKEMGGEKVPVILDDVLLPFDSDRKAGAIRALAEASYEMQILLFTCDAETAELSTGTDWVCVIDM